MHQERRRGRYTTGFLGDGPPVVLLHPFPVHHEFWLPVADTLASRYRLIMPDLRGHGDSGLGEGPATMEKHAADLRAVMDDADLGRAPIIGVSIGGYVLFEFWRNYRGRAAPSAYATRKLLQITRTHGQDASRLPRMSSNAAPNLFSKP